jgi:hypothetical protein
MLVVWSIIIGDPFSQGTENADAGGTPGYKINGGKALILAYAGVRALTFNAPAVGRFNRLPSAQNHAGGRFAWIA